MPPSNVTQRFSTRVENYVRFRPGYPTAVIELLRTKCGLSATSVVADIASGTGIFTRLLLETGCRVFGVEPNADMRSAGEEFLAAFSRFTSVTGTAEGTSLPDQGVDIVTAAQAAHWFDFPTARQEFVRILRPGGWCVIVWNERQVDATPFLRDYESLLLTFGSDYNEIRHERASSRMRDFYQPNLFEFQVFPNSQMLDFDALKGRTLSASYMPAPQDEKYEPMIAGLRRAFDSHQADGRVTIEYLTRVYYGRLTAG